jgi:Raf kinase inhibitor-like YbhB/YbcL family protein
VAAMFAVALMASCSDEASEPLPADEPGFFTLQASSFSDGDPIPIDHTCAGEDVPPALQWSTVDDAGSFVVTLTDPDAADFVHWVVYGIADDVNELVPTSLPTGANEGANDFGTVGYRGPCPPSTDEPHTYVFTVYALEGTDAFDLDAGANLDEVNEAIECCLISSATLTGTFGR